MVKPKSTSSRLELDSSSSGRLNSGSEVVDNEQNMNTLKEAGEGKIYWGRVV